MAITIIVKQPPRSVAVRMEPARGEHKHYEFIVPNFSESDRSEKEEIIAEVNERTGRKHTLDEMEKQIEKRIKGTYKKFPKMKPRER